VPALPQAILAVEDERKFQLERTMTIKVGDKIPSATLMQMKDGGPKPVSTDDLFAGKKVVLFALPGAFSVSSAEHVMKQL
jgi:peroxiredoxin